jgi:hypothetical protein
MKNKIYKITIINVTATLRYSLVLLPKNMSDQNLKPKTCTETRLLPLQHQWLLSSWDKVFTDPLLQKSIIEFRNNLDIRIAMRKFSRCRSYYEARKGLLPYPTATTDWTHQTISKIVNQVRFRNLNVDQYQLSGNLSSGADIWVKYVQINCRQCCILQTTAANQAIKPD